VSEGVAFTFPPEVIEAIAQRAAEIVLEGQGVGAEDGWLRGAEAIAEYIDAKVSRVYALAGCTPKRIPIHHDGSALIARRSELDAWLLNGGGRRP
jgi:hypothetical protein